MARPDGIKEEVGWLKVVFAGFIAIDASLVGWLAQNYDRSGWAPVLGGLTAITFLTYGIVRVNQTAYHRIRELENT